MFSYGYIPKPTEQMPQLFFTNTTPEIFKHGQIELNPGQSIVLSWQQGHLMAIRLANQVYNKSNNLITARDEDFLRTHCDAMLTEYLYQPINPASTTTEVVATVDEDTKKVMSLNTVALKKLATEKGLEFSEEITRPELIDLILSK